MEERVESGDGPLGKAAAGESQTVADGGSGPGLWLVMVRAFRSMAELLERGIGEGGMGLSDFLVMEVLLHGSGEAGALPMAVIGEKVQLANASMTSAIDRLAERGLVTREGTPCDKRVRMVRLTEAGRGVITEVYRQHEAQIEQVMEGVGEAERAEMRAGLKRMGLRAKAMSEAQVKERRGRVREGGGAGPGHGEGD